MKVPYTMLAHHTLPASKPKEERHVHEEPVAEFLRCVTGWLHGKGLSTAGSGLHKWYKEGVSQTGIIAAMRACGYTNVDGAGDRSPIDVRLLNFYCMKDAGYKRKDNLDMCKLGRIGESPVCDGRR